MNIKTLVNKIRAIEKVGTRVVSFTYHGKVRNGIVGAHTVDGPEGRSLGKSAAGHYYVALRVMNDTIPYKAFRLDNISDFRCASVDNIK